MRPFRLARIAAEAEAVRWRGVFSRVATRIIMAVVALVFVIGALTIGHIAAWYEIRTALDQGYLATAGYLAGADLLIAIVLLLLASRSAPSRVEVEALEVRRQAVAGIYSTLNMTQILIPIIRMVANARRNRR